MAFRFPAIRYMATKLAIGIVGVSILSAILSRNSLINLALVPREVWQDLALWQPLTYVFVASGPLSLIFSGLIVWSLGSRLEEVWGPRRLVVFSVGVLMVTALLVVPLALLVPALSGVGYEGASVMATLVWVMYGLHLGRNMTNFWGIPVSGHVFALIGAGFVLLVAVFGPWQMIVPDVIALALGVGRMKLGSPRFLWLRFQSWRLQRQLKGRSKHLRIIDGDRNTPRDSDRYLH